MDDAFSTNGNHVYYKNKQLAKVSASGFQLLYEMTYCGDPIGRGFIRDKNTVYWFKETKQRVTVKAVSDEPVFFQIVGNTNPCYAKDNRHVLHFHNVCQIIPNADPQTFNECEGSVFAKDSRQVYAFANYAAEGLIILDNTEVDVASFSAVSCHDAVDKHNFYHYHHVVHKSNDLKYKRLLDPETEDSYVGNIEDDQHLKTCFQQNQHYLTKKYPQLIGWWHKDYHPNEPPFIHSPKAQEKFVVRDKVYFAEEDSFALERCSLNLVRDAQPDSFEELNPFYGKDTRHAYFHTRKILNVDLASFKPVYGRLAKDKFHYYYNGWAVETDYKSFIVIEKDQHGRVWGRDNNGLLSPKRQRIAKFKGYRTILAPVENSLADQETVKRYDGGWSKDNNQVYVHGQPFKVADAATFQYLHKTDGVNYWAKDKNHLYNINGLRTVKGIDGGSFKTLNHFWGMDDNYVFCFITERIIRTGDVKTFAIQDDNGRATDKQNEYWFDTSKGYAELKKKKLQTQPK